MMLKMMEENHLSKYRSLDIEQAQIRSFSLLSKKLVRKKLALVLGSIFLYFRALSWSRMDGFCMVISSDV